LPIYCCIPQSHSTKPGALHLYRQTVSGSNSFVLRKFRSNADVDFVGPGVHDIIKLIVIIADFHYY